MIEPPIDERYELAAVKESLTTDERTTAEETYTRRAFDYEQNPVGSRDWTLFWSGWCARATQPSKAQPPCGADGAELAALVIQDLCESEPANPDDPDTVCVKVNYVAEVIQRHAKPAAPVLPIDVVRFEQSPPCYICGYNSVGYFSPATHPCAEKYHAAMGAPVSPATVVPEADPFGVDADLCGELHELDTDIGYRAASRIGQLAMLAASQREGRWDVSAKMKPCGDGGRHRWVFVNNRTYRSETSRGIALTLKGRYKCAMCEARKIGEPQHDFSASQREGGGT